jgi:hypothetical protein
LQQDHHLGNITHSDAPWGWGIASVPAAVVIPMMRQTCFEVFHNDDLFSAVTFFLPVFVNVMYLKKTAKV